MERRTEEVQKASLACRDAAAAWDSLKIELAAFNPEPPKEEDDPQLLSAREQLSQVRESVSAVLRIKESLSGQQALRPLLHPRLVWGVTILVYFAQALMIAKQVFDVLTSGPRDQVNIVFDVLLSLVIGAVAPSVVAVSAVALGRVFGAKRAEDTISSLGLDRQVLALQLPDHDEGALATIIGWLRTHVSSAWAGAALVAALGFTVMSLVLTVGANFGLSILEGAPLEFVRGPLQVAAMVFIMLPVGVLVAHLAGDNPLEEAVARAEAELEAAESEAVQAEQAFVQRLASFDAAHNQLVAMTSKAEGLLQHQRSALGAHRDALVSARVAAPAVVRASVQRLLALERGLNDRLPLAFRADEYDPAVEGVIARAVEMVMARYQATIDEVEQTLAVTEPKY